MDLRFNSCVISCQLTLLLYRKVLFFSNLIFVHYRNAFNGVKYWCAQISILFPDEKLISPLVELLDDENDDIRVASCTSLSQIDDDRIIDILKNQINVEKK